MFWQLVQCVKDQLQLVPGVTHTVMFVLLSTSTSQDSADIRSTARDVAGVQGPGRIVPYE